MTRFPRWPTVAVLAVLGVVLATAALAETRVHDRVGAARERMALPAAVTLVWCAPADNGLTCRLERLPDRVPLAECEAIARQEMPRASDGHEVEAVLCETWEGAEKNTPQRGAGERNGEKA